MKQFWQLFHTLMGKVCQEEAALLHIVLGIEVLPQKQQERGCERACMYTRLADRIIHHPISQPQLK